ncbi:MAG: hypothetical protein V5A55_08575 [Halovenus sp.]
MLDARDGDTVAALLDEGEVCRSGWHLFEFLGECRTCRLTVDRLQPLVVRENPNRRLFTVDPLSECLRL